MEHKNLTQSAQIPALGLGTWHMGGGFTPDHSQDHKYVAAIKYALEQGITHIDTAELYGHGHAEQLVARAIKGRRRADLFITSKVSPHHLSYRGVLAACARTLERLGTDYLDLYLIHWPNPLANMPRVMAAFDTLVEKQLIRYAGVSNFSHVQWQEARALAKHPPLINQVHYNLLYREPENELLPYAKKHHLVLTAYSPLAKGQLATGNYPLLDELAAKYSKTRVQLVLRYLIDQPSVITIPKASTPGHIDEIMGALGWHLSAADRRLLAANFRV